MIYTYQKRKEMNAGVVARYPEVRFAENKGGVPRMQCTRLPDNVREVESLSGLEQQAYLYWKNTRQPFPVFLQVGRKDVSQLGVHYEVNYVMWQSDKSMADAGAYISQRKLFAEQLVNQEKE